MTLILPDAVNYSKIRYKNHDSDLRYKIVSRVRYRRSELNVRKNWRINCLDKEFANRLGVYKNRRRIMQKHSQSWKSPPYFLLSQLFPGCVLPCACCNGVNAVDCSWLVEGCNCADTSNRRHHDLWTLRRDHSRLSSRSSVHSCRWSPSSALSMRRSPMSTEIQDCRMNFRIIRISSLYLSCNNKGR